MARADDIQEYMHGNKLLVSVLEQHPSINQATSGYMTNIQAMNGKDGLVVGVILGHVLLPSVDIIYIKKNISYQQSHTSTSRFFTCFLLKPFVSV